MENFNRGWEFPGGFINFNESIYDAAIREVKEETGMDVQLTKILGFEHDVIRAKMVVVLTGVAIGGELENSNENKNVGFYTYDEALKLITIESFQKRLERCFNEPNYPYFIEL